MRNDRPDNGQVSAACFDIHVALPNVLRTTFARACVDTRLGLDLTQQQVADRIGVSRSYVAKVELGWLDPSLDMVEKIADALGLDIRLAIQPPIFQGGPRVLDSVHARCSAYADRHLRALEWAVAREVEVIHGRSHGWIDLLAFDQRTGTLLIIEIKTRLDNLGALERQIGWYERIAWQAARRLGWGPARVVSCVFTLASDEVERVVRAHRDMLALAFPMRAPQVMELLDRPEIAFAGRGFAMIDPSSRRRDWLIRTSVDGRRSRLPYAGYGDALHPIRPTRS